MNRRQKRINPLLASLLLGGALLLAACAPAQPTAEQPAATTAEQPAATATTAEQAAPASAEQLAAATAAKLNLNTVTEAELLNTIPDFGNRMVREFFEYRPYISIQQFRKEIGKYVDAAQVATYEQYVYVPVNVNEADAATLIQIPGLDQAAADNLIAARPYASTAAFLDKVAEVAPAVDRAVAESYVEVQ